MKIKHIRLIFIIIVACSFIVFNINVYYNDKQAQTAFIEKEFHGIILEIIYIEGNRGFPSLKINSKWIYMGVNGQRIQNYIKVSDSIVKDSGTETITVYRKNFNGNWDEKVFK